MILHRHGCSSQLLTPYSHRKFATAATVAAGHVAASRQQQRHKHVQELSMVLLVNKNLENQLGRGLVEHGQLLTAHQLVDQADYALLVVGSASTSGAASQPSELQQLWPVLYANHAAVAALTSSCGETTKPQNLYQLEFVQLPEAISSLIQLHVQQQVQQPQHSIQQQPAVGSCEGQHSSCVVLQDVAWQHSSTAAEQPANTAELTIHQLLCCPVNAPNDAFVGLALMFDAWRHADGCLGVPGWPRVSQAALPSEEQLQQAADAVRGQAEAVRQLKQGQGLGNKEPAVVAAVSALQQLKQQLADMEGLQRAFQQERQGQLQQLLKLLTDRQQQQSVQGQE